MRFEPLRLAMVVSGQLDLHSLELDAWLHSGSSDFRDPTGVVVYSSGVDERDYFRVLTTEKHAQMYRFLSELDIRVVKIVPAGPVKVKKSKFAEHRVRAHVESLWHTLDRLHHNYPETVTLTPQEVSEKIDSIVNLGSERQKVNAIRHVHEMTFLLKRYDAILKRFRSRADPFTNEEKTPREEVIAVSRTLFGVEGDDVNLFKLSSVDWRRPYNVQLLDEKSVPWKLVIPLEMADAILRQLFESRNFLHRRSALLRGANGKKRLRNFLARVRALASTYRRQYLRYASFNSQQSANTILGISRLPVAEKNKYMAVVQAAARLRKLALDQYTWFKVPFRDDRGNRLFDIYLHDPEMRGASARAWADGKAFPTAVAARRFLDISISPIFGRIPPPLYAGRLQAVLLAQGTGLAGAVKGATFNEGREMVIYDNGLSLVSVAKTVRRECGQVLHFKLQRNIQTKLDVIYALLSIPQVPPVNFPFYDLILQAYRVFSCYGPMLPHDPTYKDLLTMIYDIKSGKSLGSLEHVDGFEELKENVQRTMAESDMASIRSKIHETRHSIDRHHPTMADARGFTSYLDDAAKIAEHMVSDARRAALFARTFDDTLLRKKVSIWLNEFAKNRRMDGETVLFMEERMRVAAKWAGELGRCERGGSLSPVMAALFTEKNVETIDTFIQAETFVVESILEGRQVAWLHIEQESNGHSIGRLLLASSEQEADVHFFGVPDTEDVIRYDAKFQLFMEQNKRLHSRHDSGLPRVGNTFVQHSASCDCDCIKTLVRFGGV